MPLDRATAMGVFGGLSRERTPEAFRGNTRRLMREHGLPRGTALAMAYAVLRSSKGGMGDGAVDCVGRLLRREESEESSAYAGFLREEGRTMGTRDPLDLLREVDMAAGADKPLNDANDEGDIVDKAVASVADELERAVIVSLANVMKQLGYDKWPRDAEGAERMKRIVALVSKNMTAMGRRFNSLLRDQLRVLKSRGPDTYRRTYRRWLAGKPEEIAAEEPASEQAGGAPSEDPAKSVAPANAPPPPAAKTEPGDES